MKMRRGDTKKFKFQRKDKNQNVIMVEPDKIYVTFKFGSEETPLFQKTIDNIIFNETTGYYHVTINPEDTNNLPFGILKYDIEIIVAGNVKTIYVGELELLEEVTFASNEV